jgi:hypothetical protein
MELYESWRSDYWQHWTEEQKQQKHGTTRIRFRLDGSVRLPQMLVFTLPTEL